MKKRLKNLAHKIPKHVTNVSLIVLRNNFWLKYLSKIFIPLQWKSDKKGTVKHLFSERYLTPLRINHFTDGHAIKIVSLSKRQLQICQKECFPSVWKPISFIVLFTLSHVSFISFISDLNRSLKDKVKQYGGGDILSSSCSSGSICRLPQIPLPS